MRGTFTFVAAALLAAPALADGHQETVELDDEIKVKFAAEAFFNALRDPDKTALGKVLIKEAVIFVHDRRNSEEPRTRIIPAGKHLEGWLQSPPGTDEIMFYESVMVDGDMAHIWGPYTFLVNGATTHCGINSMSLAKTKEGWKVGNTSFTMVLPEDCDKVGAPRVQAMPEELTL